MWSYKFRSKAYHKNIGVNGSAYSAHCTSIDLKIMFRDKYEVKINVENVVITLMQSISSDNFRTRFLFLLFPPNSLC